MPKTPEPTEPPVQVVNLSAAAVQAHLRDTKKAGATGLESMSMTLQTGTYNRTIKVHLESAGYEGSTVVAVSGYITSSSPAWLAKRLPMGRFVSEYTAGHGLCLIAA